MTLSDMANAPTSSHGISRVLETLLAALLMIVIAGAAILLSWNSLLRSVHNEQAKIAQSLLSGMKTLDREAVGVLAYFDRQPDRFCSDLEISELRAQMFRGRYIKDIGRLDHGVLKCSAVLGRIATPAPAVSPDILTADGMGVTASRRLILAPSHSGPVLESKFTNVVLNADLVGQEGLPGGSYAIGYISRGGRFLQLYGWHMPISPAEIQSSKNIERNGWLYSPRCAENRPICVVSAASLSTIFDNNWPQLLVAGLLGAITAATLVVAGHLFRERRRTVESRLRRAIAADRLDVEYQPIVRLLDEKIAGAEALVRWRDPQGGIIRPDQFIPVAEEAGFVGLITKLVLRRVIKDFGHILSERDDFYVSINISVSDLADPDFHHMLREVLGEAKIPPQRIALELTEHSLADSATAIEGTRRLRSQGHTIYIDDFGTGHSSLAYLNELDVDMLKIDRSFTMTVGTNSFKVSLVPQIVEMARRLDLQVVAEGIEDERQADWLRKAGVEFGQGWLYGRPLTAGAFLKQLEAKTASLVAIVG
jgi:sensor c-di-GMP phosphodiesterase-like protein